MIYPYLDSQEKINNISSALAKINKRQPFYKKIKLKFVVSGLAALLLVVGSISAFSLMNSSTELRQQAAGGSGCDNGVSIGGTACKTQGDSVQYRCGAGSIPGNSNWITEGCPAGQTCQGSGCSGSGAQSQQTQTTNNSNRCYPNSPTAQSCRQRNVGQACEGYDGTCVKNGTKDGYALCGCQPNTTRANTSTCAHNTECTSGCCKDSKCVAASNCPTTSQTTQTQTQTQTQQANSTTCDRNNTMKCHPTDRKRCICTTACYWNEDPNCNAPVSASPTNQTKKCCTLSGQSQTVFKNESCPRINGQLSSEGNCRMTCTADGACQVAGTSCCNGGYADDNCPTLKRRCGTKIDETPRCSTDKRRIEKPTSANSSETIATCSTGKECSVVNGTPQCVITVTSAASSVVGYRLVGDQCVACTTGQPESILKTCVSQTACNSALESQRRATAAKTQEQLNTNRTLVRVGEGCGNANGCYLSNGRFLRNGYVFYYHKNSNCSLVDLAIGTVGSGLNVQYFTTLESCRSGATICGQTEGSTACAGMPYCFNGLVKGVDGKCWRGVSCPTNWQDSVPVNCVHYQTNYAAGKTCYSYCQDCFEVNAARSACQLSSVTKTAINACPVGKYLSMAACRQELIETSTQETKTNLINTNCPTGQTSNRDASYNCDQWIDGERGCYICQLNTEKRCLSPVGCICAYNSDTFIASGRMCTNGDISNSAEDNQPQPTCGGANQLPCVKNIGDSTYSVEVESCNDGLTLNQDSGLCVENTNQTQTPVVSGSNWFTRIFSAFKWW